MRHKNLNQAFVINGSLLGAIIILLLIALLITAGCVSPIATPQSPSSSDGRPPATHEQSGRENDWDQSAAEESASSSSDAPAPVAAPTATPPRNYRPSANLGAAEAEAGEERGAFSDSHSGRVEPPKRSDRYEPVTAGVVDDNELWEEYLQYRDRRSHNILVKERDVTERYLIFVQDENHLPVHDAQVAVYIDEAEVFTGRTDAGGRVLFHPLALDRMNNWDRKGSREFQVVAQKEWVAQRQSFRRYESNVWLLTLVDPPAPESTQLDLLFLVDATGSMDDEIAKLKASMVDIADQIYGLPEQPDVRFGLVHYRDRGDAYVVRTHDFTHDLQQFQKILSDLRAAGGGDYPESLNEALNRSLNELDWRTGARDGDTLRLILLVADAPPHLDYGWQSYAYDTDMIDATRRGIKIFPVGASGLEEQGEYIYRQMAQFTGGKFVFLTYEEAGDPASGPGTETSHDVESYSVDTLDRLIVRLVKEELQKLFQPVAIPEASAPRTAYPAPRTDSRRDPIPPGRPVSCTLDLDEGWNDCGKIRAIEYVDMHGASRRRSNGQAVMKFNLDPRESGYATVLFEVSYTEAPVGWTVNVGDSVSNNGYGGDDGDQSNDAEMIILDGALVLYGNDYTPARDATDGYRELRYAEDVVRGGETVTIYVANESFSLESPGGNVEISSPYLYALARQPDREGRVNYDLYAAFNRTIASNARNGEGASQVRITLIPR